MKREEILKLFQDTGAILEGHFLLSSGLHSTHYVQCARVFEDPSAAEKVVEGLAEFFAGKSVDWVVGPAMGGILLAYELARQLKAKNAFTERVEGKMALRRGFFIPQESNVIVCEDVLTTGGSAIEAASVMEEKKCRVAGIAALVNRSGVKLPYLTHALLNFNMVAVAKEDCRFCREGKPLVKPGSRSQQ